MAISLLLNENQLFSPLLQYSWYGLINTVFTEVQSLYMNKVTPEVILWCQIQHKILFVKEIFF